MAYIQQSIDTGTRKEGRNEIKDQNSEYGAKWSKLDKELQDDEGGEIISEPPEKLQSYL